MKSILIHAASDEFMESRLQVALDIARRFKGHLTLVQAQPYSSYMAVDMFGGTHMMAQALEAATAMQAETRKKLDEHLKNEGVPWDWQVYDGATAPVIADASRFADLIVMSLGYTAKMGVSSARSLVGDVALQSRAPILAVPDKMEKIGFDRAMIAYDGGLEASEAMRAALPMLKEAKSVCISEVEEKESEFPATDASVYLSRHGIKSEIDVSSTNGKTVEECLFDKIGGWKPDYVVMGAFGHGRLRETLFGGITRYLMAETKTPLFLAH